MTATIAQKRIVIHVLKALIAVKAIDVTGSCTVRSVQNGAADVVIVFVWNVPAL